MKRNVKKQLRLHVEVVRTLQQLDDEKLRAVVGGGKPSPTTGYITCKSHC